MIAINEGDWDHCEGCTAFVADFCGCTAFVADFCDECDLCFWCCNCASEDDDMDAEERAEEPEPALHRYVGEGERCELCGQVMIARVHLLGW